MIFSGKAIVLGLVKINDQKVILNCFTEKHGKLSFLIHGAYSKKSKKSAYFLPLTQIHINYRKKTNQSLHSLSTMQSYKVYTSLHNQIYKSAITLFLSEVLQMVLKEEEKNIPLYNFLENSFLLLDQTSHYSHFHLLFLVRLTNFLGFSPNKSQIHLPVFNLRSGFFETHSSSKYSKEGVYLNSFKTLLGMNFDNLDELKIPMQAKREILNWLMEYYEVHLAGFRTPKSMDVLHQVFQ